jgi:hypothetical protein
VVFGQFSGLPRVRARSKELLDRAIAATVAAIEIYNKPSLTLDRFPVGPGRSTDRSDGVLRTKE